MFAKLVVGKVEGVGTQEQVQRWNNLVSKVSETEGNVRADYMKPLPLVSEERDDESLILMLLSIFFTNKCGYLAIGDTGFPISVLHHVNHILKFLTCKIGKQIQLS